ncbi:MAG: ABC transporter permease [Gammaproteobacteria bacterium]|nr:ABC transporter permease [Gammaproteobacteria bacterium]
MHNPFNMRLRGLIRKEFLQIRRDPSSIAIAFIMPVVLLLLFGYGVSLDAKDVRLALVADKPGAETRSLLSGFEGSAYFKPQYFSHLAEAKQAVESGQVDGIVHLPADFAAGLHQPQGTTIQLIINGVDANTARIINGYAEVIL